MALIELSSISKHYVMGQHVIKAVDDVNLSVESEGLEALSPCKVWRSDLFCNEFFVLGSASRWIVCKVLPR